MGTPLLLIDDKKQALTVSLHSDLASIVQAVKRNAKRFPIDFMFRLSAREFANLKSQVLISSWGGIRRAEPYAFTEQGVAMLSSVLRSDRAIHVNGEWFSVGVQAIGAFRDLRGLGQRRAGYS
jgi:hypothetical protein